MESFTELLSDAETWHLIFIGSVLVTVGIAVISIIGNVVRMIRSRGGGEKGARGGGAYKLDNFDRRIG